MAFWRFHILGTNSWDTTLGIVDITRYPDFVRFKGLLKEQVPGVSKVYQRGFQADKANLEVAYRGAARFI
jgi:hypothetical protein